MSIDLLQWLTIFSRKVCSDTTGGAIKSAIMSNQQLAEELRKHKV